MAWNPSGAESKTMVKITFLSCYTYFSQRIFVLYTFTRSFFAGNRKTNIDFVLMIFASCNRCKLGNAEFKKIIEVIPKCNYTCLVCKSFFLACFFSSCGQFGLTVSYNEFQCREISKTTAATTLLSFCVLIWFKCYFQLSLQLEECDIFWCNNAVYKWCTLGDAHIIKSH